MYKKERKFNVIADQNERWTIRNSTAWKAQVLFLDQAWQSNSFFVNMQTQTVYLQFYLVLILNTSTCFVKHMVYKKRNWQNWVEMKQHLLACRCTISCREGTHCLFYKFFLNFIFYIKHIFMPILQNKQNSGLCMTRPHKLDVLYHSIQKMKC